MSQLSAREGWATQAAARNRTNVVWVAWRQQRFQVITSLGLTGVIAIGLLIYRLNVVEALQQQGYLECREVGDTNVCDNPSFRAIIEPYQKIATFIPLILLALPPVLGALVGGPLFAREYEHGTQILALTQSVGIVKWWATKILVAGAPVALAMLALGLINRWALAPMADSIGWEMMTPGFETRGITPAAYFVLAFAIATTAVILCRNTVAAIGSTIVIYVALLLLLGVVRPQYLTPLQFSSPIPAGSTATEQPADLWGSRQVDSFFVSSSGQRVELQFSQCLTGGDGTEQCLVDQGAAAEVVSYQPGNRYWRFQVIEAGISVLAGAVIMGVGLIRLRRRAL